MDGSILFFGLIMAAVLVGIGYLWQWLSSWLFRR